MTPTHRASPVAPENVVTARDRLAALLARYYWPVSPDGAAADDILEALAADGWQLVPAPPDALTRAGELDEAWKAVEAALPDGWSFWQMTEYSPDAGKTRRVSVRVRLANVIYSNGDVPEVSANGPTPAAALRALRAALAPTEPVG